MQITELKELDNKISAAKKEVEKLEKKRSKLYQSRIKHKGEFVIALGRILKRGDLVVCTQKIDNHHVKNIFEFYYLTKNGGFVANGYAVRTSMRNKYITVSFCYKEVIGLDDCCDFRVATEKEMVAYEDALKNNRLK